MSYQCKVNLFKDNVLIANSSIGLGIAPVADSVYIIPNIKSWIPALKEEYGDFDEIRVWYRDQYSDWISFNLKNGAILKGNK